jgi:hypothetical protein
VETALGPNGKHYGVAFTGNIVMHEKFAESLERDKQRPGFRFHVKSSKELAQRLKTTFDEANWELGGKLKANTYLVTNGRKKYKIRVSSETER